MTKIPVLWISISLFCCVGLSSASSWSYKKRDDWPKQCYNGKEQSPIALSEDTSEFWHFQPFEFFGYDKIYQANIKNNGHTVEVRLQISPTQRPTVRGGGLTADYVLEALHFHWESEHTVEGKRFPLELHLVHYDNRTRDLSDALARRRVAVLAVLFYLSPDDDAEFNPLYDAIIQLETDANKLKFNLPLPIQRLELDNFLPRDRAGFYRYKGSLTTPDCTEGVEWTIFTNGLPISAKQLNFFTKLVSQDIQPIKENYRFLQDLNDRKVYLKKSEMNGASLITASNSLKLLMFIFVFIFML